MDTQLVGININLQRSPPLAVTQETTQNDDYSLKLQTCMAPTDHENDPDVGRAAAPVAETPVTTFKMAAVVSPPVIQSGLMSSREPPPHPQPQVAGDKRTRLGPPSESKMAATDLQSTLTSDTIPCSVSFINNSNSQVFGATASTKGPESNLEPRKGPFGAPSMCSPNMAAKETISRSGGDPRPLAGDCHTNQGHSSSPKDTRIHDVIHDHVGQEVTSSDADLEDTVDKDSSFMDTEGEQYGEVGHGDNSIGEKDIDKRQEGWVDTGHLGSRILRQRSNRRPVADRFRQKRQTLQDMARPLKHWLYRHRANPYPTKAEKSQLAVASAMSLTQVSNWFANARRRLKNTVTTPGLSWGRRITLYNSCVEGNAERLSVCDDDGNDGDDQQDTLSSPNRPPPGSPPHSPRYDPCPQGQPGDALGGLLQRYLDDAYERSLQPTDRQRHPSGSLSSHDHDDWSTSSCGSPTRGLDDPMDGLEVIARQLQNVSSDGDDLYLKELSAALALTTLRYRRLSDRHL